MKKKLAIILGVLVVFVALIDVFFLLKFRGRKEESGSAPSFITPLEQETVIQQQLKALSEIKSAFAKQEEKSAPLSSAKKEKAVSRQIKSLETVFRKPPVKQLSPGEKEELIKKQLQLLEKARRER